MNELWLIRFWIIIRISQMRSIGEYLSDAVGIVVAIIDDGLFQGDILNDKPTTQKGQGVLRLLESVREKKDVFPVLLPLGVGVGLIWKQK